MTFSKKYWKKQIKMQYTQIYYQDLVFKKKNL